jgi:aminomethyltransferase
MSQKTALFNKHIEAGAKMVDFAGWEMPIQYTGIIDEHNTVRNAAGIFDVSHMGELFVSGKDSANFLQKTVPQDIAKMPLGKAEYCQLPNKNGGLIDDLIIYRLEENKFLIVLNASRISNDISWFEANKDGFDVVLDNQSQNYSMVALQGPNAFKIVEKFGLSESGQPAFFTIKETVINNIPLFIARTGYTGEDGFEILFKNEYAGEIWDKLLEAGDGCGLKPIGLGARDTLRMEAGLMLYGNDLDENTTPVEARLGWSIPKDKTEEYNGKDVIMNQVQNGSEKVLIGFEMTDRAIARHENEIYSDGKKIGVVSSGGFSPTLNKNIGMGYVNAKENIKLDFNIQIMVRNKLYNAKVVKRPFVQKRYKIQVTH